MGALAPIANLVGFTTGGPLGAGGQRGSTPPLDNFFGLDSRFLRAPAGGTALFNNVLFASSNQQVPVDFLRLGFYTGVPPLFGGQGFQGLPSRFDLFAGNPGPVGVDAVLQLENSVRGNGGNAGAASRAVNNGSAGSASSKASTSKSKSTGSEQKSTAKSSSAEKESFTLAELKSMSLGDILKLLA